MGEHDEYEETAEQIEGAFSELQGLLIAKSGNSGLPVQILVKTALISVNAMLAAHDRWARLEYGTGQRAPFWLDEREAQKIYKLTRDVKGPEIRLLRREIKDAFKF